MQRRLGLITPDSLNIRRRALLVVLVGWVPLVVLTILQGVMLGDMSDTASLLRDAGAHARHLFAAPLLILAEAACAPHLNAVVSHFAESGIVRDDDRGRFAAAIRSTRRLLSSRIAEIAVVILTLAFIISEIVTLVVAEMPAWTQSDGLVPNRSPAGWWMILVSLPILLVLSLGWLWRLLLWVRLLWLISKLPLRLMAAHPDHAAGLGFLGHSTRAFALVALAFATILAGHSAKVVLEGGALPGTYAYVNAGLLAASMAIFVAPLFVFTSTLMNERRRGIFAYGALAGRVGGEFERRWLDSTIDTARNALDKPDFSAVADLSQVASNVQAMRFVPVDLKDLMTLAVALLLPFLPVGVLLFPADVILAHLKSLLF
ncbi:hypothetical protein [Mesorhizobium sp. ZC-5]|uniref:hypothetical protein n=1 Tax=Mesorhizobium sp. ZC-5 TaxID=2986066 RepID=UPI0021E95C3A|nr:hypothetical protein [Mesorhizobium sp. ZC-5]MCV3241708.1 hypothetical protein [Mesorhizobium sp. ZC-5]